MKTLDTASSTPSSAGSLPIYNLKAVVQETGLKADTLRAWERRYGLPEPKRTESGHRLYSQRDIDTLKWLSARLEEGLNISRAVALWQELDSRGENPLDALRAVPEPSKANLNGWQAQPGQSPDSAAIAYGDTAGASGVQMDELRRAWLGACLAFDEQAAEQTLNQAFAMFPPELVCTQVLQHSLAQLGEGWLQGRVTIQQEHFASSLAMRRLQTLVAGTPSPTRTGTILVACPPDEEHTFSPMLLVVLLRRKGWHIVYLGANVPMRDLEATVSRTRPTLVVLIAQRLHTAATLLTMSKALAAHNLAVAFGGRIFANEPSIGACIPGYYLGDSLEGATESVEQIMASPTPRQAQESPLPDSTLALHHYRDRRAQIEATIWDKAIELELDQAAVSTALDFMRQTIIASLSLCGSAHLETSVEWMVEYLANHQQMSSELIEFFLSTYLAAAEAHLDPRGGVIVQWLHSVNEHESQN